MDFNIFPFLEKYFNPNEPVILACSTGPDSMFLLYKILETPYKKNLVACYFNHKLRPEADEEEKFLKDLGKKKGFKVKVGEWRRNNVRGGIQKMSEDCRDVSLKHLSSGLEEKARIARYVFFDEVLQKYSTNKIILAHHLDDKIETFFFNLVRGTKLTGLINMTKICKANFGNKRGKTKDKGKIKKFKIFRPLLDLEKKDIQAYLDENHLKYFADKSNFDTKITRNKLRLEILPKFEEINKNYKENISNLMNYLEQVKENIDEEVKRFLNLSISYNILFPTSRMKNLETKKKFYVISEKEEGKNPPNLFYQGGRCPLPLTSPYQGEEQDQIPPLNNGGVRGVFEISAFNELSTFMQKEVIRYIYFISNGNSTIGLTESNIDEIIRFINGKNNKTIKEIGGLKMRKENKVILY